ncbi:DUF3575 domain-containing protein [Larkinella insperata]|uniref:DUF3575 domain-containing protein n=1 Tax=Larkinella insperata TaxID=332158 RepID=A0ABW3QHG2_9BACT
MIHPVTHVSGYGGLVRMTGLAGLLFVSLLPSSQAVAQDTTRLWTRPNALKTNVLAPVSIFYERALTRRLAFRTSARLWPSSLVSGGGRFFNATLEGKLYTARPSRLAANVHPAGLFINPYLKARTLRYVSRISTGVGPPPALDEKEVRSMGFGLAIGYQWVIKQRLVVEVIHGHGVLPPTLTSFRHTRRYSPLTTDTSNEYLTFDFRTGISLGYAF